MSLSVYKFGGTSVGSVEKIKKVADKVVADYRKGTKVVVVVSAMAGETDRLTKMAQSFSPNPSRREMDLLLSNGERVSASFLTIAINTLGVEASSLTGRQAGIVTDSMHSKARIKRIDVGRLNEIIGAGGIPVVAGFQGISEESEVTTLGRGGSDLTAVAIAHALKADQCIICKDDVDGVYTSDPAVVPDARRIPRISYVEMLEMSGLGAKVLHSRAVEMAAKYEVPIKVIPTFEEGEGTLIVKEDKRMESEIVSAVITDKNQSKITLLGVPDSPGIAAQIFGRIAKKNIVVDMIIQNVGGNNKTDLSFTVPQDDAAEAKVIAEDIADKIGADNVKLDPKIGKISVVGVGMRSHSGVAARMFQALADENINIMMISTSEIKISCVISEKQLKKAANVLHKVFDLGA
ncbi:MAG: aspartate kinase [Nitrospinota bacterium]|nr:aspartate kinase [Nitrospinota bacterium]